MFCCRALYTAAGHRHLMISLCCFANPILTSSLFSQYNFTDISWSARSSLCIKGIYKNANLAFSIFLSRSFSKRCRAISADRLSVLKLFARPLNMFNGNWSRIITNAKQPSGSSLQSSSDAFSHSASYSSIISLSSSGVDENHCFLTLSENQKSNNLFR